jgi:hypothetical protein
MHNHILRNLFVLICFFAISACQKAEIEEQPSGIITAEVEKVKYNFEITKYISFQLIRGDGIFEAVNYVKEESIVLGLTDDYKDNNGILHDFFDIGFRPDTNRHLIGIKILGEGFQSYIETIKITITKADFATKTIEGTFSFDALGELSKRRIKVENGYFKIKMPAWLYQ